MVNTLVYISFFFSIDQRRIVDSVLQGEANKYHIDAADIQPRVIELKYIFFVPLLRHVDYSTFSYFFSKLKIHHLSLLFYHL